MAKRKKMSHEAWCELITEQSMGGESIRAFCAKRQLLEHSFYWHKRRMNRQACGKGFREVALPAAGAIRVVVLETGSHIEVERGFDVACFRELVQALR